MKKVRLGLIGLGHRGVLANSWRSDPRVQIVAGADLEHNRLVDFQKENQGAETFTDYRDLLAIEDLDAVAITSPDYCHEEQAIAAFKAGKHVFCEKPLAITVDGCDHILSAWKESGKKFMVGFNMRYMNTFITMKEIAESGVIGEIKAVWVRHFIGYGGMFYYHDWHGLKKNCTSLLLQKASHDIDIIHWVTGHYTKRVAAFGSLDYYGGNKPNSLTCSECPEQEICPDQGDEWFQQCAFRQEIDIEDNNVMIMELDNGIKATYMQCHFTPDSHRNYVFIGTEGRMENFLLENKIVVKTRRRFGEKSLSDRIYEVKPAEGGHGGADPVICADFVDMIMNGTDPVATPLAGRMSVAAGCAAESSLRQGGVPIDIKPLPISLTDIR
jgi:predicted dehydrogenase